MDGDLAGGVNVVAIEGDDDVAGFEDAIDRAGGDDGGDEDAFCIVVEAEGFTHGWVVEWEVGCAEFYVVVVGTVFDVF